MQLQNDDYSNAKSLVDMAKGHFEALVREHQAICPHEDIAECDYQPEGIITYSQPPIRMCLYCGISEDGWQIHKILKTPKSGVRKWTRENLIKARIGAYHMRDGDIRWIP